MGKFANLRKQKLSKHAAQEYYFAAQVHASEAETTYRIYGYIRDFRM